MRMRESAACVECNTSDAQQRSERDLQNESGKHTNASWFLWYLVPQIEFRAIFHADRASKLERATLAGELLQRRAHLRHLLPHAGCSTENITKTQQ